MNADAMDGELHETSLRDEVAAGEEAKAGAFPETSAARCMEPKKTFQNRRIARYTLAVRDSKKKILVERLPGPASKKNRPGSRIVEP